MDAPLRPRLDQQLLIGSVLFSASEGHEDMKTYTYCLERSIYGAVPNVSETYVVSTATDRNHCRVSPYRFICGGRSPCQHRPPHIDFLFFLLFQMGEILFHCWAACSALICTQTNKHTDIWVVPPLCTRSIKTWSWVGGGIVVGLFPSEMTPTIAAGQHHRLCKRITLKLMS